MSVRRWVKTAKKLPPVSTAERRYWLELYIRERVQGGSDDAKRAGLVMGVHLGNGAFRLQGDRSPTMERIDAWRPLMGNPAPVNNRGQING